MNNSLRYPATPGQPLDYWLSSVMARMAPSTTPSALRDMAWAYGRYRGLAGACTGIAASLLGMASAFVVPRTCCCAERSAQNSRRDFRRYIDSRPALRDELVVMSLNWRDPHADRNFGPL